MCRNEYDHTLITDCLYYTRAHARLVMLTGDNWNGGGSCSCGGIGGASTSYCSGACTLLVGYWPSRSSEATQPAQQALVVSGRLLVKWKGGDSKNIKASSKATDFHTRGSHCKFAVRSATVGAVGPNLSHKCDCQSGCAKCLLKPS